MARKPKQLSPDDEWLAHVTAQVARTQLDWLKRTLNVNRAICTLTQAELLALAGAAVSEYELAKAMRSLEQRPYDAPDEIT